MTPRGTSSTCILNVGSDAALVQSREVLLRSAGYLVESASSIEDAIRRLRAGDFDLVVLCHSISPAETKRLIFRIRSGGSGTPVISVAADSRPYPDPFANLTVGGSPDALFCAVDAVLQQGRSEQRPR